MGKVESAQGLLRFAHACVCMCVGVRACACTCGGVGACACGWVCMRSQLALFAFS